MKPVLRTFTEATSGIVTGMVSPASANAYVMAVSADKADTTSAYANPETGSFLMRTLLNSDYTFTFEAEGFNRATRHQVISLGQSVDFGVVEMTPLRIEF